MPRKTYYNSRTRLHIYISEETEAKLNFIINVLGISKVDAMELVITEYYAMLEPKYKSILDLAEKEEQDAKESS